MHISHIGQASVPTHTSKQLRLSNILHVPSVTHDLLYVHRLTLSLKSFVNFSLLIFFLRIGIRGTFFLEVAAGVGFMSLMRHPLFHKSSVVFVLHHHSGTLALVIQRLPLFGIFSIVMSSLFSLVVIVIQFMMPVNKARVISFLFLSLVV
jgi:hypothetical protein